MSIVLIGCNGCGKTTLGHKLADHLWKTFVEADEPDAVTAELLGRDDHVIALGADVPLESGALRLLEEAGVARRIYLHCEPPQLQDRLDAAGSPAALSRIEVELADRQPVYEAVADHVFDVTHLSPDDAVRYLIRLCL